MNFKKLSKPVMVMALVATAQVTTAEEWQQIDHYQVKGGLVKDTKTGLTWMRCSYGQIWNGSTCTGEATKVKWGQTIDILKNFEYAGYSNWRVPTKDELKSLIDCNSGKAELLKCSGDYKKPTILQAAFPATPSDWFWSSSPYTDGGFYTWIVKFSNGHINEYGYEYYDYFVRLVRSK